MPRTGTRIRITLEGPYFGKTGTVMHVTPESHTSRLRRIETVLDGDPRTYCFAPDELTQA